MINGFYSAKLGLTYHQEQMNVVSNNLANVNTTGYKSMRVSFTDLMYQNINRPNADEAMVGHGVRISGTSMNMKQGPLEATNYALDFALTEENTFFAVQDGEGNIRYTRAGNFILSSEDGDTFYLATGSGERVLDADLGEIEISFNEDDGSVELTRGDIGVFRFANPYGLTLVGENRYEESVLSGEAVEVEEPGIMNGYLEGSGVETSTEMVKVIEASKAFSFNSRMIQVADEVEQIVNGLR